MQEKELTEDIVLYGLKVRTKNSNELNSSTAKIGPLWNKFISELSPQLSKNSKVYGLYLNYESDASREFDLVACTDQKIDNLDAYTLRKGKYLVFSAIGSMPQVVVDTWINIWNFFSINENKYCRNYITDFELYINDNEIEVHIGIS